MCGRFAASASTEDIVATFAIDEVVDLVAPTWNAAPTDPVPAVVERLDADGAVLRKLVTPRWGLVPSWAKDARGGARMINARSETVATKPAFAPSFAQRRCLIPADGFYEWETVPPASGRGRPAKLPWFVRPADGGPMVMAGIYAFWRDRTLGADAPWLTTCSIITTQATDALGTLHDRMPMVVRPDDWDAWLDPRQDDPAAALGLLAVDEGADVSVVRVGTAVNQVRADGPELLHPAT
ncbi:SOS response-associated peptidase [Propioniciclava soli]|uniref:Abasic site processing protein n=1 Tax=Propioniciclava soli TaxID=2775081 RepID=A0ABZ3C9R4_9ACTN|nr:SOS response-associated peptidase [Propioniciclava soli]